MTAKQVFNTGVEIVLPLGLMIFFVAVGLVWSAMFFFGVV